MTEKEPSAGNLSVLRLRKSLGGEIFASNPEPRATLLSWNGSAIECCITHHPLLKPEESDAEVDESELAIDEESPGF